MRFTSRFRSLKFPGRPATATLLMLLFAALSLNAAQAAADPAVEKLEQALQEQAAAIKARGRGDEQAASEYMRNAQRLFGEAREIHLRRMNETPRDPGVLVSYGDFLTTAGNPDLAAETLQRAVSFEPAHAEAWLALGRALTQLGPSRAKQAQEALNRAVALADEEKFAGRAWTALGMLYWGQGLYEFAAESFEKALEHDPERTEAKIGLAGAGIRRGRVTDAANALDALTSLTQEQQALAEDVVKEGLEAYDRVRMWYPDTAESHLAYAKLAVRANRIVDCVVALRRAADLEPRNPVIWNFLGSMHAGMGQVDRARDAFERSLEINPNQPRTRSALESLPEPQSAGEGQ